jgi:hypothetical protein
MLASGNHSPEPDLTAAFTIANFYHLGLRGVKQDLRLALKYYETNHLQSGMLRSYSTFSSTIIRTRISIAQSLTIEAGNLVLLGDCEISPLLAPTLQ